MKIVHLSLAKVFHRREVLYKTMKETWLREGGRRWKIHFPPFTVPSSSLKIIISISKACNQTGEKKEGKVCQTTKRSKWRSGKILREIFNYLQFSVFISLSFQNGQKNSSLFFWLITEITLVVFIMPRGKEDQVVMQRLMECDCLLAIAP